MNDLKKVENRKFYSFELYTDVGTYKKKETNDLRLTNTKHHECFFIVTEASHMASHSISEFR